MKNRDVLIKREWKDDLERYVTGIVQNHRHKMLAIVTLPDQLNVNEFHRYKGAKRIWGFSINDHEYIMVQSFDEVYGWY